MDFVVENLNYDFNLQQHLFSSQSVNMLKNARERAIAIAWVNKLTTSAANEKEAKLRNDFMYYLNTTCGNGELVAPFNENPPKGPLFNILNLLVRILSWFIYYDSLFFLAR